MKAINSLLFCLMGTISASAIGWNQAYTFEKDGKWGLMVNEEVCLLPTFESLRPFGNYFIYTDNDREGILDKNRIITPAIYDKIDGVFNVRGLTYVSYSNDGETGLKLLGKVRKYIDLTDHVHSDTIPDVEILPPGKYSGYKTLRGINDKDSGENILICTDEQGNIYIVDLENGANITPYFDLKKLGGNIKDVLKGKKPYSKLRISRHNYQLANDIEKVLKKHPELKRKIPALPQYSRVITQQSMYTSEEVLDSITIGEYEGVITKDGYISIPLQYSKNEDLRRRNPANIMVFINNLNEEMEKYSHRLPDTWGLSSEASFEAYREYYNKETGFYETCISAWEKLKEFANNRQDASQMIKETIDDRISYLQSKYDEVASEARKFNSVASVTGAMNGLANNLRSIAGAMQSGKSSGSHSDYEIGGDYSANLSEPTATSDDKGFSLSEQTSYNRDKRTYESYDSQLSSHFAGNAVMSQSSVNKAQSEMKRLRSKWESRGKSFPHLPNEDR